LISGRFDAHDYPIDRTRPSAGSFVSRAWLMG
jgi:hypothetical protein